METQKAGGGSKATRKPSTHPSEHPPLSEPFLRTLLETIPAPVFYKDAQGRYLGCNDPFTDYLGLPREEILGRTVHEIAPRELADIYQRRDQELFDHPGVQVYESRVRSRDGSVRDVLFRKATFLDAKGQVDGLVGVILDITDRKHRIVADGTYDWEFWLTPEGRFEYCSPSCERITGHGREAFIDDPDLLLRIIHPEDLGAFLDHRREMQDGGVPCAREIQFRLIRSDGAQRWIGHVCQPVFGAEGHFLGNRGSNRDITQQKQAEEALRASEARYRTLINEMTEGVALHECLYDESGALNDFRFVEINPAFERLLGLRRADVIGRLVSEAVPGEAPGWIKLASEVARMGRSVHFENYFPPMKKHLQVFAYCPAPNQFAVTLADITERKHSERERDRLLSQLRAVIDHIDTGLIISDAKGHVLEMNPVARQLCGYTTMDQARQHGTLSRALFALFAMDGTPVVPRNCPRMRTLRGEIFSNWELRVRRRDSGVEGIISFGGTPVRDQDGHMISTVVTLRDVTERWKAQEVLERKVRERTAELHRFNQTLQAVIDCNQAIIRAKNEPELLQEFCRLSMEVEGIDLAWVGLAEPDDSSSVRLAAAMGFQARELGQVRISWADDAFGQGPASRAIRTGQICLQPNLPSDPSLVAQCEADLNLGFGASIALPLQSGNCTFGALVLYTATPEIFNESQMRMLRELANNLSRGIQALRTQEERDRALRTAESRAEQLRALSLELAQVEQRERRRLAQILHDNLQQLLVGATFHTKALKDGLKPETLQKPLDQLSETLAEALEVSRAMTMELSPPIFYEKGLVEGLEWLATQMHQKHGLTVSIEILGKIEPETEQIRMFLLDAVRECLLNTVKHAQVDHARVRVRPLENEKIEVTVMDGGVGFDASRLEDRASSSGGFGLFNIREKLKYLKGCLAIESAPGHGSRFTLVVPTGGWREDGNLKAGNSGLTARSKSARRKVGGALHADQDPDHR